MVARGPEKLARIHTRAGRSGGLVEPPSSEVVLAEGYWSPTTGSPTRRTAGLFDRLDELSREIADAG